ncbi:MAG: hypothetical protein M3O50_19975 [Myxococcota bacterium]|nr:hypothetical protein [Myxococcota bacterium]
MTEPPEPADDDETRAIREVVKRALSAESARRATPDILRGVQRRLRKRSRGKFFADGWSTVPTRIGYVLVALVTLLAVAVAYYALGPTGVR